MGELVTRQTPGPAPTDDSSLSRVSRVRKVGLCNRHQLGSKQMQFILNVGHRQSRSSSQRGGSRFGGDRGQWRVENRQHGAILGTAHSSSNHFLHRVCSLAGAPERVSLKLRFRWNVAKFFAGEIEEKHQGVLKDSKVVPVANQAVGCRRRPLAIPRAWDTFPNVLAIQICSL